MGMNEQAMRSIKEMLVQAVQEDDAQYDAFLRAERLAAEQGEKRAGSKAKITALLTSLAAAGYDAGSIHESAKATAWIERENQRSGAPTSYQLAEFLEQSETVAVEAMNQMAAS